MFLESYHNYKVKLLPGPSEVSKIMAQDLKKAVILLTFRVLVWARVLSPWGFTVVDSSGLFGIQGLGLFRRFVESLG